LNELGPDATVAMLAANRSAEPIQHGRMDILVGLHHFFKIATIVHVQQWDDVRVPVSNMAEDGHWDVLASKEVL
jgi:hypothetical protein